VSNPAIYVTAWGWFWLIWLMTAVVVELYWVITNTAYTLSNQIWGLEQIDLAHPLRFATWTPGHWIISVCLWSLFLWLSIHMPFGYLR
jgi:hypothetical protein